VLGAMPLGRRFLNELVALRDALHAKGPKRTISMPRSD
jgi:hypothetical protein